MALAARQSLVEVQTLWTDQDLVTVLQELDDQARAQEEARRG